MLENTTHVYLWISATIFGLVAVIHLVRVLNGWAFAVGPISIPISASWIGFAITAALCGWAIRLLVVR